VHTVSKTGSPARIEGTSNPDPFQGEEEGDRYTVSYSHKQILDAEERNANSEDLKSQGPVRIIPARFADLIASPDFDGFVIAARQKDQAHSSR